MKYRHAFSVAALAVGLGSCASMSSNSQSNVVTQNGSYYAPADAGYGDYYYAPEPRYDYYYDHSYFYGSPFYNFGAYCSMRYRYCPPFWYDPFLSFDGFGFYSPWYGWYDPIWYYGHRHHHHPSSDDGAQDDAVASQPPSDDADDDATDGRAPSPVRRRWSGSFPTLPIAGSRFDRLGTPTATSIRARRAPNGELFSTPEPRVRRSESSSRATDEGPSSAPVRSHRRGDGRRGSLD